MLDKETKDEIYIAIENLIDKYGQNNFNSVYKDVVYDSLQRDMRLLDANYKDIT